MHNIAIPSSKRLEDAFTLRALLVGWGYSYALDLS